MPLSRFGYDPRKGAARPLEQVDTATNAITNDSSIANLGTDTVGRVTADSIGLYALFGVDAAITPVLFAIKGTGNAAVLGTWGSTAALNIRVQSGNLEIENRTTRTIAVGELKIVRLA